MKKREERRQRWESYCKGCGICCYEKKRRFGGGYYTDLNSPCKHLDTRTKRCRVYSYRFAACSSCRKMTIFHALFTSFLPDTCGYVEHFRIWRKSSRHLRARQTPDNNH